MRKIVVEKTVYIKEDMKALSDDWKMVTIPSGTSVVVMKETRYGCQIRVVEGPYHGQRFGVSTKGFEKAIN